MTGIEKAIDHFVYGITHDIFRDPVTTHARFAVDALREKQARESGCDYCLTTWPNHAGGLSDIWHGNQLSVGYGVYREINYCPMCGARVEAEPTGEDGTA